MALEIERKFLVDHQGWSTVAKGARRFYQQGYLSLHPERTVRVRISETEAYLTIKGKTVGASRLEFEYPLPKPDAEELLSKPCTAVITKYRYVLETDGIVWEVDEFCDANEGLLLAEVELETEDQLLTLPAWVGQEVTSDPRYYNSALATHPFSQWKR